jgi:iron-regulated transporter 1
MWETAIVFYIADLTNNSLIVVAFAGFLSSLSIFLLMPRLGQWLDSTDRLFAIQRALMIKLYTVSIAYVACGFIISIQYFSDSAVFEKILIYTLPFLCAITSLCFCAITQSMEKDWIVVLSNNDTLWLSKVNSIMSQIDLGKISNIR